MKNIQETQATQEIQATQTPESLEYQRQIAELSEQLQTSRAQVAASQSELRGALSRLKIANRTIQQFSTAMQDDAAEHANVQDRMAVENIQLTERLTVVTNTLNSAQFAITQANADLDKSSKACRTKDLVALGGMMLTDRLNEAKSFTDLTNIQKELLPSFSKLFKSNLVELPVHFDEVNVLINPAPLQLTPESTEQEVATNKPAKISIMHNADKSEQPDQKA